MSPIRFRDEESSTGTTIISTLLGAAAGFAVGMFVAQRVGGFSGLTSRLRKTGGLDEGRPAFEFSGDEYDEIEDVETDDIYAASDAGGDEEDELADDELVDDDLPVLEERVLEAFNNDPVLAERAIDIGSIGRGVIELAGWVESDDEAEHAITVARGVPEVVTVVNRLMIEDEEAQLDDNARRVSEGDPALTESRWEGQQVGTGRRRQGTSDEADRHADPKPKLEDRWLSEKEALRNSAEDIEDVSAERRKTRARGAKTNEAESSP
jgi:hypothetical protein